jgi:hypothetical protein
MKKLIVSVFLLFAFQALEAHPMGLTFCDMRYKSGILTFSSRIFYADFYFEFQKTSSVKNKDYVKAGVDKKDIEDLMGYFRKHIVITVNKKEVRFTELASKFEKHEEDAYIFDVVLTARVRMVKGDKIKICDSVLLETISDQKNLINFYLNGTNEPSHGIITLNKATPVFEFVN